jgi:DNA-binding NarL/FixJ family response regulator
MSVETPLRVLLVEDSAVLRSRLTESLSAIASVEVVGASDSESGALNELLRSNYDAVVLDLQLKQGNGFNVLKAIRQADGHDHRTTVIVLTNYAFSLYRHRCLQAGADFFFDKARDYDRLPEILRQLVEEKRVQQA